MGAWKNPSSLLPRVAGEEFHFDKIGKLDYHHGNLGGSLFRLYVGLVERHDRPMPEMFDRLYACRRRYPHAANKEIG
jgi:hypothetical protein